MWIPGLDEFSRKGIKADHTPYSTMQNLTQNVICSRRDLKKLIFFRHVLKDWRRVRGPRKAIGS